MVKKLCLFLLSFFLFLPQGMSDDQPGPKKVPSALLVISSSLNPHSRSAQLAKHAFDYLKAQGQDVSFLDLRDYKLPFANGHDQCAYDDPQVKEVHDRILKADGILIAAPIYNNSVGAVAKNLIELTTHRHKSILSGKAWDDKIVGFIGASGGCAGRWAFFPFLNSLMIDANVVVAPNFAVASREDFNDKNEISAGAKKKVEELSLNMIRFTHALGKK